MTDSSTNATEATESMRIEDRPTTLPRAETTTSTTAPGVDWWLASDGKWYPPASRPQAYARPTDQRSTATMSTGLTTTIWIMFGVGSLLCLLSAILTFQQASRFQQWLDAGFSDAGASDALRSAVDASEVAIGFSYLVGFTLFVLLIIWLHRARIVAERFGGTGTSWSPGWAVGGWFIPLANAVIPVLVLQEVDRLSSPKTGGAPVGERWRRTKLRPDGWIWWLCMVAGTTLFLFGDAIAHEQYATGPLSDPDSYSGGLYTYAVGLLFLAVSAVSGAFTIKRIGAQLNRSCWGS